MHAFFVWVENVTDGRTDGLTWVGRKHDQRTDGRTDGRTHSKNGDGLTHTLTESCFLR